MLQLAGFGDAVDDFNFCEMNPDDEVCVAFEEANEIQMPEDYVGRDPLAAGMQEVAVGTAAGVKRKAGTSWKTVGLVAGAVAGLGVIGYLVARR